MSEEKNRLLDPKLKDSYIMLLNEVEMGKLEYCTRELEKRVTAFLTEINDVTRTNNDKPLNTEQLLKLLQLVEVPRNFDTKISLHNKIYIDTYISAYRGRRLIDYKKTNEILSLAIKKISKLDFNDKQDIIDDLTFIKILNDHDVDLEPSRVMKPIYERHKDHIGMANFYSRMIAQECIQNNQKSPELKEAEKINKRVLSDEGEYAKFIATKGLIAHANRNYEEAIKLFNQAISLEGSFEEQYIVKLTQYKTYEIDAKIDQANDVYSNVDQKLEDATKTTMEIIALFIAIMSVVLSGVTIGSQLSSESLPSALLVFTMIPLVTIGIFSWLKLSHYSSRIENSQKWKLKFYAFCFGLCILIFAYVAYQSIGALI